MTSPIAFQSSSTPLTVGAEIELQLLDPVSFDLTPCSPDVLKRVGPTTKIHAELFQSMIEVNSGICRDVHELERDISASVALLRRITDQIGVKLAASGTHPFAHYQERKLYPAPRYQALIDRNQWIARRLMIFGLHVHVGMRDGEHAIQMNNALLHYLPLLLALSASSPYWRGEDTELASSRITIFEALPTGGHPCLVKDWADFEALYDKLQKTNSVRSVKDIWWDIRPSPGFGTIEVRICDGLPTLKETMGVVALIHALTHVIDQQLQTGKRFPPPSEWIMRENKWRASRYGMDADMIVDEAGHLKPMRELVLEVLAEVTQETKLNYETFFQSIRDNLDRGFSYNRQRSFANTLEVTRHLNREFESNRPEWT